MNSEYEIFTPVGFLWKKSAGYTVGDRGEQAEFTPCPVRYMPFTHFFMRKPAGFTMIELFDCYCDHRNSCGNAFAGAEQGKGKGTADRLHEQYAPDVSGISQLFGFQ